LVSWKGAVLLVAALAGLGVYAWMSRPGPAPVIKIHSLIPCNQSTALEIRIDYASGKTFLAERADVNSQWTIRQPVSGRAAEIPMSTLEQSVDAVQAQNTIRNPGSPSQYGLDHPREVLTCRVRDGSSYTLSIGGESFDSAGYYARKSGDEAVYVISSVQVDEFDRVLSEPPVLGSPLPAGGPSPSPSP
jgi:uncharacterized protein DUF4340